MTSEERNKILDKHLPLKIGTRVATVTYESCKRGDQHDERNKATIIDKDCLVGDFMYLIKLDKEFPGWCFGKSGKSFWSDKVSDKDDLSWEYASAIVPIEEESESE